MTTFQIVSDLHLDYRSDKGLSLVTEIAQCKSDYLIIAGDLSDAPEGKSSMELVLSIVKKPVIFVPGNHEYFHSSIQAVDDMFSEMESDNFIYLKNKTIEINGNKIGGTTLWYEEQPDNFMYYSNMYEFDVVKDIRKNVYKENDKSIDYILCNPNLDILITHHLPSNACIQPMYKNSDLNRFFVCPILDKMEESRMPKVWVYGHTHSSSRFELYGVDLICNPRGNPYENKNGFDPALVVTLP